MIARWDALSVMLNSKYIIKIKKTTKSLIVFYKSIYIYIEYINKIL